MMDDSRPYKTLGVGTIIFQLVDESSKQLTEVHHIPTLSNSLISLGVFEAQSYKYVSENGYCNIYCGDRLLMPVIRHTNLYFLQDSVAYTQFGSDKIAKLDLCEHCIYRKQCRISFGDGT